MLAGRAFAAAIDHAANADEVAGLEFPHGATDCAHAADDFMTGDDGIDGAAPVVAGGVQVAVADAGVEDVDNDVIGARRAGAEGEGCKRAGSGLCGVGADVFAHGVLLG